MPRSLIWINIDGTYGCRRWHSEEVANAYSQKDNNKCDLSISDFHLLLICFLKGQMEYAMMKFNIIFGCVLSNHGYFMYYFFFFEAFAILLNSSASPIQYSISLILSMLSGLISTQPFIGLPVKFIT